MCRARDNPIHTPYISTCKRFPVTSAPVYVCGAGGVSDVMRNDTSMTPSVMPLPIRIQQFKVVPFMDLILPNRWLSLCYCCSVIDGKGWTRPSARLMDSAESTFSVVFCNWSNSTINSSFFLVSSFYYYTRAHVNPLPSDATARFELCECVWDTKAYWTRLKWMDYKFSSILTIFVFLNKKNRERNMRESNEFIFVCFIYPVFCLCPNNLCV